ERSAQHDLERALGDRENAELLADRLTLLGDLDAAAEGPGGDRRERSVDRRTSASTDGATASVEESERNSELVGEAGELFLSQVELPGRRHHADVLRGVRVAEHDLLVHAPGL